LSVDASLSGQSSDRRLTEELGEEKAVALLEGDTLPAHIVRATFILPRIALESLPGVLVVGGEAGRVGGLGDLAVVDLLEGVEALAGGRHGVHQMHGGGSLIGDICDLEINWRYALSGCSRRSRVRVWLSFHYSHEARKKKPGSIRTCQEIQSAASGFNILDSFTTCQTPTSMY